MVYYKLLDWIDESKLNLFHLNYNSNAVEYVDSNTILYMFLQNDLNGLRNKLIYRQFKNNDGNYTININIIIVFLFFHLMIKISFCYLIIEMKSYKNIKKALNKERDLFTPSYET